MPFYYPQLGATVEVAEIESLAKGSLIVGDGAGAPTAFAVGANDFVLTADSSTLTGVKWAAAAAAGEVNTASNVGTAGTGWYDGKVGVDLQFRKANSLSSLLSIALDAGNQKVDFNFSESGISFARTFALMGC